MSNVLNLPEFRPSVMLDFSNSGQVDPRIQSIRASSAICTGPGGRLRTLAANAPCIDYDAQSGRCLGLHVGNAFANVLTESERMWDTSAWTVGETLGGGAFASVVESHDVLDIYGKNGPVAKVTIVAAADTIFARKSLMLEPGVKIPSIFVYVPSQAGVDSFKVFADFQDTEAGDSENSTEFDKWIRFTSRADIKQERQWMDFNVLVDGTYAPQGFKFYVMGAQLVQGDILNAPYIKTAESAIARTHDILKIDGELFSEFISDGDWAIVVSAEKSKLPQGIYPRYISLNDGTINNEISVVDYGPGAVGLYFKGEGAAEALGEGVGSKFKMAFSKVGNQLRLSVDGKALKAIGLPSMPPVNQLSFGVSAVAGLNCQSHIGGLSLYPHSLTDAQLQRLSQP